MWPQGRTIFDPSGIIWTYMVEVHLVMLNTNYQGSWPPGFRQEDFFTFSLYKPMLNMYPLDGAISGLRSIIWTYLVEVY